MTDTPIAQQRTVKTSHSAKNYAALFLFVCLVVFLQIENYVLLTAWALFSIVVYFLSGKAIKHFILTALLFGGGFLLYLYTVSHLLPAYESESMQVLLNRLSLIFILIPLFAQSFFSRVPFIAYWKKPLWDKTMNLPFIWSGPHRTKIKLFLIIALATNVITFLPFTFLKGFDFIKEVWALALVFSIINALLEELIWRGALLSRFSDQLGEKWAVLLTSLGFGLQHYSLGFSWIVCLAFSIGGFFYAGITIKSNSLFPAILWHFLLNVLMVISGLILVK